MGILALSDSPDSPDHEKRVADAFVATGVKTKNGNEAFLALLPQLMFCGIRPEWLDRGRLKQVFENDKLESMPTYMIMLYRTSMLLRGTCLVLQENADVSRVWRPWAEQSERKYRLEVQACLHNLSRCVDSGFSNHRSSGFC